MATLSGAQVPRTALATPFRGGTVQQVRQRMGELATVRTRCSAAAQRKC